MCDESPCIHQVTLALSLLCLFSPFPSLVAVLSPGAVQNNTHTETPNRSNAFLEFQITIACARAWEALWVSDAGLIAQCQPHPPPLVFICHPSLLGYRADSPHLTSATLVHVTQHQPGPGLTGQNTTHQLLVSPSFSFSSLITHTHTHTHTHTLLIKDINTGLKREASHQTCLISEKMQTFSPNFPDEW